MSRCERWPSPTSRCGSLTSTAAQVIAAEVELKRSVSSYDKHSFGGGSACRARRHLPLQRLPLAQLASQLAIDTGVQLTAKCGRVILTQKTRARVRENTDNGARRLDEVDDARDPVSKVQRAWVSFIDASSGCTRVSTDAAESTNPIRARHHKTQTKPGTLTSAAFPFSLFGDQVK